VHSDLDPGETVAGVPAIHIRKWRRAAVIFGRLPEMLRDLRRLKLVMGNMGKEQGRREDEW